MVEVTVVLVVFGVLGIAILRTVQTGHTAKRQFDIHSTAENLVRNQLESVFDHSYKEPGQAYPSIAAPDGYSVTAEALLYDQFSNDVEVVRITVFHHGQPVKVFETLRANR